MGTDVEKFEKTSTLPVSRGLYVLRYTENQGVAIPARAAVWPGPGSEKVVEIVSAPGISLGKLERPGSAAVIRVEQDAEIVIGVNRTAAGGSLEASLRLEVLAVGAEPTVARGSVVASGLRLLAHVAMRGDVEVGAGEWVAGPSAPGPIEGLEIRGLDASGCSVEAQVLVSTKPPRWSAWTRSGEYVGTRGRSLPLSGVRLRLSGGDSERVELVAEAAFLGSLVKSQRGREVEFLSGVGADPLVGLKFSVEAKEFAGGARGDFAPEAESKSKVRIFRAVARN